MMLRPIEIVFALPKSRKAVVCIDCPFICQDITVHMLYEPKGPDSPFLKDMDDQVNDVI